MGCLARAGAEGAERALSRGQPAAADAAVPTPVNKGSASAAGAEAISKDRQQNPLGSDEAMICFCATRIARDRLIESDTVRFFSQAQVFISLYRASTEVVLRNGTTTPTEALIWVPVQRQR